jgi:SAM-dependent methyltransferase
MTAQSSFDKQKAHTFVEKVLADTSGMAVTIMAHIGDRLGLFKTLTEAGALTSTELAARAQVNERYALEWLRGMTSAGYLAYDAPTQRFSLPAEHRAVFAHDTSQVFFGGIHQFLLGVTGPLEQVIHAFRNGGGVPQSAYSESAWEGLERDAIVTAENWLVKRWLPELPDVRAKLAEARGALIGDIGFGGGRALIKLAQTFPHSRYVGYDVFAPTVERATRNAQAAGVADRVRFEARDLTQGVPELFDIIFTLDVIHDAAQPIELLRAIRAALKPDGIYVCMDTDCSDKLEENINPLSALRYGFSLLYCLTTSLAHDGAGLGTMGLTETTMRELCAAAGFASVRKLNLDGAINAVYEVRP